MVGNFLSLFTIGAMTILAVVLTARKRVLFYFPYLVLFLAVYLLDNLILVLVNQYPQLQIIPNTSWGDDLLCLWSGKLYSALMALLVAWLIIPLIPLEALGLTLRQHQRTFRPILASLILAGCTAAILGMGFDKRLFNPTVLIYLAVMPGLNEELIYRGLLLGILNIVSPPDWMILGAKIGWGALITSLLFGLLHGFWIEANGSVHLNWIVVLFNGLAGAVYSWQKERSCSLIFPLITHGVIDFLIVLVRMI